MSGTEKTNPYLVKLWDGTLERVAVHDHRFGDCDLPSTIAEHLAQLGDGWRRLDERCRWELHYTGIRTCCCGLCRGQAGIRREVRGARRRTHMVLGELQKSWRAGEQADFD